MIEQQTTSYSFWPRHISWLTIVFAILTIVSFIAVSRPGAQYIVPMVERGGGVMRNQSGPGEEIPVDAGMHKRDNAVSGAPSQGKMMDPSVYYPYPSPDVPVTDTREFLKVYYNASMHTRDVQGLTRRIETTVRGYNGRIDQESSSPQYGFVSFVVPQSKYDAFRAELEGLVGSKFLTVNISSQNLLPQKLSIEEQQKQVDTLLLDFKAARQKIVSTHTGIVQSLKSRIDADLRQLAVLRAEIQTPQILDAIETLSEDWSSLKQQLANENASYAVRLNNADENVKYAETQQKAVQTQDQALLDNVATVTGTVSVQWIGLLEIVLLYLPGYWIPTIFMVLTFLSILWDRRRFGTV